MSSEVLLSGLGLDHNTISDIKALFTTFGPIKKIIFIQENEFSFCFIHYASKNDAANAVSSYRDKVLCIKNTQYEQVTVNLASDFHHLIDPQLIPPKSAEKERHSKSQHESSSHAHRSRSPHATSSHRNSHHGSRNTSKSSKSSSSKRSRSQRPSRSPKRAKTTRERETANYIKNENITFYNVLKENKSIENQKKDAKFQGGSKEIRQAHTSTKENTDSLGPLNSFMISRTEMKSMKQKNLQSTVMCSPAPKNKIERFNVACANDSWSSESDGSPCMGKNLVPHEDSFKEINGNL